MEKKQKLVLPLRAKDRWLVYLLLVPVLGGLAYLMRIVPVPDWYHMFRPAVHAFLATGSPYGVSGFFNPPWTMLGYFPIALLPPGLSAGAFTLLELAVLVLAAVRFGAKPWAIGLLFLSPFTLEGILLGNVDMFVALGLTLAPVWGLFLVLVKPQLALGAVVFWLVEAWRGGRLRGVLRVFAPVTAALLVSFLAYGVYFLRAAGLVGSGGDVYNLWPYSVPFGLALLAWAVYRQQLDLAAFAGFLLTPYLSVASVWIMLFTLLRRPKLLLAGVVVSWPLFILIFARHFIF